MKKHEFQCIKQRLSVNLQTHEDALALAREVEQLRAALAEIHHLSDSRDIDNLILVALGEQP